MNESPASLHERIFLAPRLRCVVALCSLVALTYYATCFITGNDTADLKIYLDSAVRLRNGESLYQVQYLSSSPPSSFKLDYLYPPALAALLASVSSLPRQLLILLWQVGLVVASIVSASALAKLLRVAKIDVGSRFNGSVVFILLAMWPPALDGMSWGQINSYVLVLLVLAAYFTTQRFDALAGCAVGIAAALKGTPILLSIPLLINRRWRALGYCVVAGVAMHLPLMFHPNGMRTVPEFIAVSKLIAAGDVVNDTSNDYSLRRILTVWMGAPSAVATGLSLSLLVLFAIVSVRQRQKLFSCTEASRCLCGLQMVSAIPLMIAVSPLVWFHHLVWLFPVLLIIRARSVSALATCFSTVSYLMLCALLYVQVFVRYRTSCSEWLFKPIPIFITLISYLLLCRVISRLNRG